VTFEERHERLGRRHAVHGQREQVVEIEVDVALLVEESRCPTDG
jgi:hypothetical protein